MLVQLFVEPINLVGQRIGPTIVTVAIIVTEPAIVIRAFEHSPYSHKLTTYVAVTAIFKEKEIITSQFIVELAIGEVMYTCKIRGIYNRKAAIGG